MRAETQKITTAAVCTALAVIMCVFTVYLPFSFMPLYLAAFCIFLACKRGSIVYGILCALATVGIMFAMSGLSVSWIMLVVMFAPYGILAYFMNGFSYFKVKSAIIRGVVMAAFFNLTLGFVYLIATRLVIGADIPIEHWVHMLGGYWVLAVIGTVVLVPLDFVLSALSAIVLKRIPMPASRKTGTPRDDKAAVSDNPLGLPDEHTEKEKKYDIFGYEISDGDGDENTNVVVDKNTDGGGADKDKTDGER